MQRPTTRPLTSGWPLPRVHSVAKPFALAVAALTLLTTITPATLLGVTHAQGATAPAAPAAPQPLLPDLRVLEPSSLYIVAPTEEDDEKRLKFATVLWNAGPGVLEVHGSTDPDTDEISVQQVLYGEGGLQIPGGIVGRFNFEHRHGHLHLGEFARYELWSVAEDGSLLELVALNDKVGFCLMDNVLIDEELTIGDGEPKYPIECGGDVQGISPGYGDIYVAQLYEQDLVITDLPDGRYALINTVNPAGVIVETTTENNSAMVYLVLEGDEVRVD